MLRSRFTMQLSSNLPSVFRFIFGVILIASLWRTTASRKTIGCHLAMGWRRIEHETSAGCETYIRSTECSGSCLSNTILDLVLPIPKQDCRCCKPSKYAIVAHRLTFWCRNGDSFRQKVWLPSIEECSCLPCSGLQLR